MFKSFLKFLLGLGVRGVFGFFIMWFSVGVRLLVRLFFSFLSGCSDDCVRSGSRGWGRVMFFRGLFVFKRFLFLNVDSIFFILKFVRVFGILLLELFYLV